MYLIKYCLCATINMNIRWHYYVATRIAARRYGMLRVLFLLLPFSPNS